MPLFLHLFLIRLRVKSKNASVAFLLPVDVHVLYNFKGSLWILDREGGLRVRGGTHNDKWLFLLHCI